MKLICTVFLLLPSLVFAQVPQLNYQLAERLLSYQVMNSYTGHKTKDIIKRYPGAVVDTTPENKVRYIFLRDDENKSQTLSFRWTANLKNAWLDVNFRFIQDDILGIELHRGFRDGALEVRSRVASLLNKDYKTIITGHSMGAAIGAILAHYLQNDGYNVVELATFGQPRFTNAAGALKLINKLNYVRTAARWDFVTMLPPEFLKFRHLGANLKLLGDDEHEWIIPREDDYRTEANSDTPKALEAWNKLQSSMKKFEKFEMLYQDSITTPELQSVWGPGHELTNYIHKLAILRDQLKN